MLRLWEWFAIIHAFYILLGFAAFSYLLPQSSSNYQIAMGVGILVLFQFLGCFVFGAIHNRLHYQ